MGRKPKDDKLFPTANHLLTDTEIAEQYGRVVEQLLEHLNEDPVLVVELAEHAAAVHWKVEKHRETARLRAEKVTTSQAAARPRDDQKERGTSQDKNRQKVQVSV